MKSVQDRFSSGIKFLLVCHAYYASALAVFFLVIYALDALELHVVADGGAVGILFFIMLTLPGVIGQLVYVIPAAIHFSKEKKRKALGGLLTGAIFTGFLNIVTIMAAIWIGNAMTPDTTPKNPFLNLEHSTATTEPPGK